MAAETIQVQFEGRSVSTTSGATIAQILEQDSGPGETPDNPVVLASVNGRRTSLSETLSGEERIRLIRLTDPEARATIQRTVLFLAAVAVEDRFPDHSLLVHFSYGGGVYCELDRPEPLTEKEIRDLADRMQALVEADLPLTPQRFGLRALLKIFQRRGDLRNYRTARYLRKDSLLAYRMEGSQLLYYGLQLPSTGQQLGFQLVAEAPGFVLLFPREDDPGTAAAFHAQPQLLNTMRDYSRWLERIELQDTGCLNEYIVQGRTSELIQVSEGRHSQFFVEAAQRVAELPDEGRLVLLAGPSSSGKTSSAKRLMVQLRVLGLRPFALSLDNYFVDRDDTPRDEDGDFDFESLGALKVDLFNEHLLALMEGKEVRLPRFDFRTGRAEEAAEPTRLEHGQPLLVEGIHALNPALTPSVPDRDKLLIYVSALCHLNINNFSYIRTTYGRLFRRIVRDAQFRGYTASETLARWSKVRHGEEKHIFPFQDNADLFFNSGLAYEMAVLKLWAEPRLAAVESDDPNYDLARNLIDLLALLLPIDASQVPPTSLLREFIGGSGFSY